MARVRPTLARACEVDAQDERKDSDDAGQHTPWGSGGDADGREQEAEGRDAEDLGQQRGGAFARDVDGERVTVVITLLQHGVSLLEESPRGVRFRKY